MKRTILILMLLILVIALLLAGCGGGADSAAGAERYFQALVAADENQLVDASCAAWEQSARLELGSFTAVSVELQDLACQETGQEGETSLVACSGTIVANYGNEVLEIDLGERVYEVIQEGGEWRLCGYR